ncbi:hypothetical protein [Parasphingorhabdus sp.]|uniref:hypothetical protein n=1 Tax=Parasphingorhabdus sp. TaxID=2709688 RepID=UPI002B27AE02|nr:hypothetical protein [Parasphingorhabdus sp.]
MMMQRPLAALLGDLADGMILPDRGAPVVAWLISIEIPIDLRLDLHDGVTRLLGDAPIFRTRTAFDPEPAQLSIRWEAVPLPETVSG